VGEEPPAPKPAAKPEPQKKAPAVPNLSLEDEPALVEDEPAKKPAMPNMELDDAPKKAAAAKKTPAAPPKKAKEEEVFDDFETVEEEELDEVQPVEEEHFDELEEVADSGVHAVEEIMPAEDVEEAESVEEVEEAEEIEEEPEPRRDLPEWAEESRLLRMRLIHVKPQKVSFVETVARMDNAGHNLVDPDSGRRIGEAVEVRDGAQQAVRYLVGRTVMETRVEIREGRHGDVLAVIRRPPYLWESALEILDPDNRVLGVFTRTPFSALTKETLWISSKSGKKLLQMRPQSWMGKMVLMSKRGEPLGEMLTESAFEKKIKIYWMTRGCGYYLRFTSALDDRPEDKLRFLAAVIGLDLFMWEHMR
jgi:hypothetical protein